MVRMVAAMKHDRMGTFINVIYEDVEYVPKQQKEMYLVFSDTFGWVYRPWEYMWLGYAIKEPQRRKVICVW